MSNFFRRIDVLLEWMDRCVYCPKRRRLMFCTPHLLWFWREVPRILKRRDDYAKLLSVVDALFRINAFERAFEVLNTSDWYKIEGAR